MAASLTSPLPRAWAVLWRPFVLDLRALALLRMGLGAVLLLDLGIRVTDLEAHYANLGVLPLAALHERLWTPYQFSLHAASGMWQAQALLFGVAAAALALALGYRTRLATVASWVLLVSLQNRNPMIGQGGDDLLRMLLLWGIFLPWGRVWAWDTRAASPPAHYDYASAATVAYVVQLALLYWCTALLKSGPEWTPRVRRSTTPSASTSCCYRAGGCFIPTLGGCAASRSLPGTPSCYRLRCLFREGCGGGGCWWWACCWAFTWASASRCTWACSSLSISYR